MKTKHMIILPIILGLLILPVLLFAQPTFTDDVSDVPIDGGLSLLAIAGVGYGIQKMKSKKMNKTVSKKNNI